MKALDSSQRDSLEIGEATTLTQLRVTKERVQISGTIRVEASKILLGSGVEKKGLAKVFKQNRSRLIQCVERARDHDGKLSTGKLRLQVALANNGRLQVQSVISDTLGSEKLSQCLITRVRQIRGPMPSTNEPVEGKVELKISFE